MSGNSIPLNMWFLKILYFYIIGLVSHLILCLTLVHLVPFPLHSYIQTDSQCNVDNSLRRDPLCWKQLFAHWAVVSDVWKERKVVVWCRCEHSPSRFQGRRRCAAPSGDHVFPRALRSSGWDPLGRKKAEKSADLILFHLIPHLRTLCPW